MHEMITVQVSDTTMMPCKTEAGFQKRNGLSYSNNKAVLKFALLLNNFFYPHHFSNLVNSFHYDPECFGDIVVIKFKSYFLPAFINKNQGVPIKCSAEVG